MSDEEKTISIRPAPGTCCPEMDVTVCRGCGTDHGREYLIRTREEARAEERERIVKNIKEIPWYKNMEAVIRVEDVIEHISKENTP